MFYLNILIQSVGFKNKINKHFITFFNGLRCGVKWAGTNGRIVKMAAFTER